MTLHVAYICPWFAMTVGDRLLTTSREGRVSPFDALTNKTVVVMGPDCAVAISYTGLAHIDGSSTANWIGEQVLDFRLHEPRLPGGGHPIQPSPAPRTNLHQIVTRLSAGLQRDLPRQRAAAKRLEVAIVGFVMKRRWQFAPGDPRNARPIYTELVHDGSPGPTQVNAQPRMWREPPGAKLFAIGTKMPDDVCESLVRELRSDSNGLNVATVEALLVDAVRKTSALRPAVGNECMAVKFVRGAPDLGVTFHRDPARSNAAFAPFIAGPTTVMPPTIIGGRAFMSLGNGGWRTHLDVNPPLPPSNDGLVFAIGGHPQKPFPG